MSTPRHHIRLVKHLTTTCREGTGISSAAIGATLRRRLATLAAAGSAHSGAAVARGPLHQQQHRAQSAVPAYQFDEDDDCDQDDPGKSPHRSSNPTSYAPLYVAATRQHTGKTSTCVALMSGLKKRFEKVGFMKPVGQQALPVTDEMGRGISVDKDAVMVKDFFGLDHLSYRHTNPVLIPKGYTRDYLDGKITKDQQRTDILQAYNTISAASDITLCEGTGHVSVGSIVDANNAEVASWLNAKMVLVANGGLGKTFDELNLNKVLCDLEGVDVCGVIINKVDPTKLDQTRDYLQKALDIHWGEGRTPLLGCIPDQPNLGCPSLSDMERLFGSKLLTGMEHGWRHYHVEDVNLVATSLQVFLQTLHTNAARTLYICHASREDILLGFLLHGARHGTADGGGEQPALVVTGTDEHPLSDQILDIIHGMNGEATYAPPVILAPHPTHRALEMLHNHTPKLNTGDTYRASSAIDHYEPYIDFDLLLEQVAKPKENVGTK